MSEFFIRVFANLEYSKYINHVIMDDGSDQYGVSELKLWFPNATVLREGKDDPARKTGNAWEHRNLLIVKIT
eukprot:UN06693